MNILIGETYIFKYPAFGTPDSTPGGYREHSGLAVTVEAEIVDHNEQEPARLFRVRANDGWVGEVWGDELRNPQQRS